MDEGPQNSFQAALIALGERLVGAFVLLQLCALLLSSEALSQTIYWDGSKNDEWSKNDNWTTGISPNAADAVVEINDDYLETTTYEIKVDRNRTLGSLTIDSTQNWLIHGGDDLKFEVSSGNASLSISSGSSGNNEISADKIKLKNNLDLTNNGSGTLTLSSGEIKADISGTTTLTLGGTGATVASGPFEDGGGSSKLLAIEKTGSGALTLSSSGNTFTGGFTLTEGSVLIGDDNVFNSDESGSLTLNGGALEAIGGSRTVSNPVTVGGDYSIGGSNALELSGTMALGGATREVTVSNTADTTFSGVISNGGVTKAGAGVLQFSANNTYASGTTINAGTLQMSHENALGTGAVTINSGGILEVNFSNATAGSGNLTLSGGSIDRTIAQGTESTFSGQLDLSGSSTIKDSGNTASGALTLSGVLNVNGGTTTLNADGANSHVKLDGSANITIAAGATLATTGTGTITIGVGSGRTIIGNGSSLSESTLQLGDDNTFSLNASSGISISGSGTGGLRVEGSASQLSSVISDSFIQSQITQGGAADTDSGTFTYVMTDGGAVTRTFTTGPTVPTDVRIGFDGTSGVHTYYLGDSGGGGENAFQNWGGVVIKGGDVKLGQNQNFTGTSSGGSEIPTTLQMSGGKFFLDGSTATFEGDVTLSGGTLNGTSSLGGVRGTIVSGGNVTVDAISAVFTPNLTMNPSSGTTTISGSGSISGNFGTLEKTGAGDVQIDREIGFSQIDINSGSLILGGDNLITNAPEVRFQGGTLDTGGYDQSGLGTANVTASSLIDMGSGNSVINFADSSGISWNGSVSLTIQNWSGTPVTGGGTDQLYFGSSTSGLTATQVGQIFFKDPFGGTGGLVPAAILPTGEVVPIPEPSTVFGLTALVFAVGYRERRRLVDLSRYFLSKRHR